MPGPLGRAIRWEAIGEPGDFEPPDELDDGEIPATSGRPLFLRGYLTKDDTIFVDEEYNGWVPREDKNAEGETETRFFIKVGALYDSRHHSETDSTTRLTKGRASSGASYPMV